MTQTTATPRPARSALVPRVPPLVRPGHRHRAHLARRRRRRRHGRRPAPTTATRCMWVFVVAILFRFLFVSLIARYHLCNQHGEGVLDGLARLHPLYAPVLFFAAVVMGHVYGSYMTRGVGEVCRERVRLRRDLAVGGRLQRRRAATWCSGRASARSSSSSSFSWRCCRSRSSARRSGSASIPRDVARGLVPHGDAGHARRLRSRGTSRWR